MWRLKSLAWSWLANAIVLIVVVAAFADVTIGPARDLFTAALLFGLLNTFVKPLAKLLTLPLAVITLGIVWFLIAMLMLELTSLIVGSFEINGFLTLVWATLTVWAVNLVLDLAPGPWRGTRRSGHVFARRPS